MIQCCHILHRSLDPNHQPISLVKTGLISPSVEWLSVSTGWLSRSWCKHKLGISVCLQTEDAYVLKKLWHISCEGNTCPGIFYVVVPWILLNFMTLDGLQEVDVVWTWNLTRLQNEDACVLKEFENSMRRIVFPICCSSPYACKLHDTVTNCSKQNVSIVC